MAGTGGESLQKLKLVQNLSSCCAWFRMYAVADIGSETIHWLKMVQDLSTG